VDDSLNLIELWQVRPVNRLLPEHPADSENLAGLIGIFCDVANSIHRGVGPEQGLLGLLLVEI